MTLQQLQVKFMMGSGKSAVITPIVSTLLTQPNVSFAIVLLPEPLFPSASADIERSLAKINRPMERFRFERKTMSNWRSLVEGFEQLRIAAAQGVVVRLGVDKLEPITVIV
jgi:hypothetical protein